VRSWVVASGIVERDGHVLLVQNRRRDGRMDWSPPGGVVEVADGEGVVDGLTREVMEETGLTVTAWEGPVYQVDAEALDMGWHLRVEVHRALEFEGDLVADDPDDIVVDARFFPVDALDDAVASMWLPTHEPRLVGGAVDRLQGVPVPRRRARPGQHEHRPAGVSAPTAPTILHVDMDAFFVAVEVLDDPALAGKAVIVGGSGDRGVVAACSYEARAYGVRSAMPSTRARRLCPHAQFVQGHYDRYMDVSREIHTVFHEFTPLVEGIGLDEAFLDVAGAQRLFGSGAEIAAAIRAELHSRLKLWASVGVATTKFLAKLASEAAKPKASLQGPIAGLGVKVVHAGEELDFLHPLPIDALWGVGPATGDRLRRLGIETIGDLAQVPVTSLIGALGKAAGQHLHDLAWARDPRPVEPQRLTKSVGHEETYAIDHVDPAVLGREAVRMADAVAGRLRKAGLAGRTVTIKVRFHDFATITRSHSLPTAVDEGPAIARAANALLEQVDVSAGVRLFGVSVSNLVEDGARQLSLDDVNDATSWTATTKAIDEVRDRFGPDAVGPAAIVSDQGLRTKKRGDQQWGPDQQ
jgi:DNA polymerase-4